MSISFHWNADDLSALLDSCASDEVLPVFTRHVAKGSRVLESGCGLGRFVRYLHDRGYNTVGLEISGEAADVIRRAWPDLSVVRGDVELHPFCDDTFDAVISLGVVEHWIDGPDAPLRDIYRVVKPGGVAIITVPCLNTVRKMKRFVCWDLLAGGAEFAARMIAGKRREPRFQINRFRPTLRYAVQPTVGRFYEYRMRPREFAEVVRKAGFVVVEHEPIDHIDGLYHELNPFKALVTFDRWHFAVSALGQRLNDALKRWPFFHSHMQVIVGRKPERTA